MELPTKIRKFGGSLYIHIPHSFAVAMGFKQGDQVKIKDIDDKTIQVRR